MTRFGELLSVLASARVDFILVGAVAAVAHGSPRATQDIDIVYSRELANLERLVQAIPLTHPTSGARRLDCLFGLMSQR